MARQDGGIFGALSDVRVNSPVSVSGSFSRLVFLFHVDFLTGQDEPELQNDVSAHDARY